MEEHSGNNAEILSVSNAENNPSQTEVEMQACITIHEELRNSRIIL